jgi:hypothetical protein
MISPPEWLASAHQARGAIENFRSSSYQNEKFLSSVKRAASARGTRGSLRKPDRLAKGALWSLARLKETKPKKHYRSSGMVCCW